VDYQPPPPPRTRAAKRRNVALVCCSYCLCWPCPWSLTALSTAGCRTVPAGASALSPPRHHSLKRATVQHMQNSTLAGRFLLTNSVWYCFLFSGLIINQRKESCIKGSIRKSISKCTSLLGRMKQAWAARALEISGQTCIRSELVPPASPMCSNPQGWVGGGVVTAHHLSHRWGQYQPRNWKKKKKENRYIFDGQSYLPLFK
jgi:hypothetical protein